MADVGRLKKSRSANRNVVSGLVVKARDIVNGDDSGSEKKILEVQAILKTIEIKRNVITELDAKILDAIGEEEMDEDVELATNFESKVIVEVSAIEEKLKPKKHLNVPSEIKNVRDVAEKFEAKKAGVNLPKIVIKMFYGDPNIRAAVLW